MKSGEGEACLECREHRREEVQALVLGDKPMPLREYRATHHSVN